MRNSKIQSKILRHDAGSYVTASSTGVDNYSSFMERSKTEILMAGRNTGLKQTPILKTQAAWNVFQDENNDGATER